MIMTSIILTTFFLGMIVGGILTGLAGVWLAYLYDKKGISYGAHANETLRRIQYRIRKKVR